MNVPPSSLCSDEVYWRVMSFDKAAIMKYAAAGQKKKKVIFTLFECGMLHYGYSA